MNSLQNVIYANVPILSQCPQKQIDFAMLTNQSIIRKLCYVIKEPTTKTELETKRAIKFTDPFR